MVTKKQLRRRIEGLRKANPTAKSYKIEQLTNQLETAQHNLDSAYDRIRHLEEEGRSGVKDIIEQMKAMSITEWSFLSAILKNPKDTTPILILADWLEDHYRELEARRLRDIVNQLNQTGIVSSIL